MRVRPFYISPWATKMNFASSLQVYAHGG